MVFWRQDYSRRSWREPLLNVLFPREVVHRITSLYFPMGNQEDCLFWEFTKDRRFTVKSGYLLGFESRYDHVFRKEQGRFPCWGRVWSLKLPPKFQLLIWKVIHRIIAVKVALIRRGIEVSSECAHCGQEREPIERLFFKCDFAKRVRRASHLGFDFDCGSPMSFCGMVLQMAGECSW